MKKHCDESELALKSFFVGPQAENSIFILNEVNKVLYHWLNWRKGYNPKDGISISGEDQHQELFLSNVQKLQDETQLLLDRFSNEIPKFSPRYMGHMFSEISIPAIVGHFIALLHNPNNISHESSRIGLQIEKESIRYLSNMIQYPSSSVGHFTSGGTIANFEAVVRGRHKIIRNILLNKNSPRDINDLYYIDADSTHYSHPSSLSDIELFQKLKNEFHFEFNGFCLLVPQNKHYSWLKARSVFNFGTHSLVGVELNKFGQICTLDLEKKINEALKNKTPIALLSNVFGSTELGTVDDIHSTWQLLNSYQKNFGYKFWHHIDAAYGGYFACLDQSELINNEFQNSINSLKYSSSITIDPHKLGYVPYSAGVFICKDPSDYYIHRVSAPYVDFKLEQDPGPYTLEGSRPSTGAVATYMAAKCIGLNIEGHGRILERTMQLANKFKSESLLTGLPALFINSTNTNIVCFAIGNKGDKLSLINTKTKQLTEKLFSNNQESHQRFYVSKTIINSQYRELINEFCQNNSITQDTDDLHLVRLTIMNPFVESVHSNIRYINECIGYFLRCLK